MARPHIHTLMVDADSWRAPRKEGTQAHAQQESIKRMAAVRKPKPRTRASAWIRNWRAVQ